jgi:hypothetical protein
MRHLLMDPAFPDIVGEWAAQQKEISSKACNCVNDNGDEGAIKHPHLFLTMLDKLKIAANRIW